MAKETVSIVRTIVVVTGLVITLTTTVFLGGTRISKTETQVDNLCKIMTKILENDRKQDDIISEMRRQQEYQRGVVNTKLGNLERGIERIEKILSEWEAVKE